MAAKAWIPGGLSLVAAGLAALAPNPPTFRDDIAPVIVEKCLPCHQKGGIGPFDFTTYRNFKRNLELIRIQVLSRNMPPTSAESDFGVLAENPQLTDREILAFQQFYDAGAPEGLALESPLNRKPAELGPGLSIASPEVAVAAEGVQYWRAQTIRLPDREMHIQAMWLVPEKPRVLRSAQFYLVPPGVEPPADGSPANVFAEGLTPVGNWSPGYPVWRLPDDTALNLPAGSRILVLAKYQPSGRPESGGFLLGLKTAASAPAKELQVASLEDQSFEIKPDTSPTISLSKKIGEDSEIVGLVPQARFYCGTQSNSIQIPGRPAQNLLSILKWDPFWLGSYVFPKPISAPAGTDLQFRFTYFNDERCQMNEKRDPTTVRYGTGPYDEVCRMHILIARPRTVTSARPRT